MLIFYLQLKCERHIVFYYVYTHGMSLKIEHKISIQPHTLNINFCKTRTKVHTENVGSSKEALSVAQVQIKTEKLGYITYGQIF